MLDTSDLGARKLAMALAVLSEKRQIKIQHFLYAKEQNGVMEFIYVKSQ